MALISLLGHFNGLYGQDGHEYLRQSQAIFDRWNQGMITPATVGDAEFVKGYPLAGALLRYLVSDPILALQVVSWLAFAAAAFLSGAYFRPVGAWESGRQPLDLCRYRLCDCRYFCVPG